MVGDGSIDNTLGARIRARRAARIEHHSREVQAQAAIANDELRTYIDEQVKAIHARIDKLSGPRKSTRK